MARRLALLALPALFLAGAPGAAADTGQVKVTDFEFKPSRIKIDKRDRVKWTNVEGTHTVTMRSGGQDLDSVISGLASVRSAKFRKKGTFRYVCRFHEEQGMKGKVVVD